MYGTVEKSSIDDVLERHGPLVKRIAHHLMARMPSSVQVDDLIQAGLIGLLEAARNYDASKGASFETYAGIRIRGSMIDDVRRGDWVPRSVHRNCRRISEALHCLETRLGREASDREVAGELGMPMDDYYQILQDGLSGKLFSYEQLLSDDDHASEALPNAAASPLGAVEGDAMRQALAKAIDSLPERERLILALYYDEELNLKEIGLVLGVSESRVCLLYTSPSPRDA